MSTTNSAGASLDSKNPFVPGHTRKYCPTCRKNSRSRRRRIFRTADDLVNLHTDLEIRNPRLNYDRWWWRLPVISFFAQPTSAFYLNEIVAYCVTCDNSGPTEVVDQYYRKYNRFRLFCFRWADKMGWLLFVNRV